MSKHLGRIGMIGDIHADDDYLGRAIAFFEARRVDLITSTGDIADGVGSVDTCCDLLESKHVAVVQGNHDRWLLAGQARGLPDATAPTSITAKSRDFLKCLPVTLELLTIRGMALLCHGLGANDMSKVSHDDYGYALQSNFDLQRLLSARSYRWILNGHSHRAMVRHFERVTIINAGTLLRDQSPCVVELDFESYVVSVFPFDSQGNLGVAVNIVSLADEEMPDGPLR